MVRSVFLCKHYVVEWGGAKVEAIRSTIIINVLLNEQGVTIDTDGDQKGT